MKVSISPEAVTFAHAGTEAGRYILNDLFKPYLHPLRTPDGHIVSDAMPADHRHHKGLMYALRCADLNFWEELPGTDQAGIQKCEAIAPLSSPDGEGIRQKLHWSHASGERPTYNETREIVCRYVEDLRAFVWTWRSERVALRPHLLIKSEWSYPLDDGRKINYHGLGIRFPRSWACGGDGWLNGAECAGESKPWKEVCGTTGPEVGFWGTMDGYWTPPKAAVTMRQEHGFGWFVIKGDFTYISAGPSNLDELHVQEGQTFSEAYQITVQDR